MLRNVLSKRSAKLIQDEKSSYIHAAVLIPLFREDGEYKILFTQRTNKVEHHKGQISFPGGRVDDEDGSLEETVLREVDEEIGLHREDVEIIGQIDDTTTVVSKFIVHPFVGRIPHPYDFRISAKEVERLIRVPLKIFLPDRSENKKTTFQFGGVTHQTPAYIYDGDTIWGATAKIMENFVGIMRENLNLPADGE
jgi:8-oxo-dGTP pyrophosphatase MutT (NUDIX family)